jgi:hypothetical protein
VDQASFDQELEAIQARLSRLQAQLDLTHAQWVEPARTQHVRREHESDDPGDPSEPRPML